MSEYTNHALCMSCWKFRNGEREPIRISSPLMFCCACESITNDGILVRGRRDAERNCKCPEFEPDPETHPDLIIQQAAAEHGGSVVTWACTLVERMPVSMKEACVYSPHCVKCLMQHDLHRSRMRMVTRAVYEE